MEKLCSKNDFDRFTKPNVYSHTKPNDKKLYIGCKPADVYSLFNGKTSTKKKTFLKEQSTPTPEEITIDQSALQ